MSRKVEIRFEEGDAPRTATFNIDRGVSEARNFTAFLDVTVVTGTAPTLDVSFQEYDPVSGKWFAITGAAFAQATGVTSEAISLTCNGSRLRAVATIGGTSPEFTFTLGANGAP